MADYPLPPEFFRPRVYARADSARYAHSTSHFDAHDRSRMDTDTPANADAVGSFHTDAATRTVTFRLCFAGCDSGPHIHIDPRLFLSGFVHATVDDDADRPKRATGRKGKAHRGQPRKGQAAHVRGRRP